MKDDALPIKLNAADAVARGLHLRGTVALAQLPRLAAAVAVGAETVASTLLSADLRFSADAESLGRVQGRLNAPLALQCQRCLQPTPWALEITLDWALVNDEASEERLLANREPVWLSGTALPLHERMEDEALLALPLVAYCAGGSCGAAVGETNGAEISDNGRPGEFRPNPFASLKGILPR